MRSSVKRLIPDFLYHKYLAYRKRRVYERWKKNGEELPPPRIVKELAVYKAQKRSGAELLIETGTYHGRMIQEMKGRFREIHSVELDDALFNAAKENFRGEKHVHLYHGDSADLLPGILDQVNEAAVFWLDGHFSGGHTAKGEKETPIWDELEQTLAHPHPHYILIDDARCFDGTSDYPTLQDVESAVLETRPGSSFFVEEDIIRVHLPVK